MTDITVNDLGGTIVEAEHPAGRLVFEDFGVGQWLTQKGEPAKKSRRRYLLKGEVLDSVSSIVDTIDKPALVRWAEDWGARGGAEAQRLGELDGVPEDEIVERVRLLRLGAEAKRDEGAARGTAIHAAFESLARFDLMPKMEALPREWRPWLQGAAKAWLDLKPDPLLIEEMVCHPTLGYAGRPDIIATVRGQRTLLDYKTGKGRIYDQAHFQTRLYAMALEHSGIEPVERILIVGISDEGDFQFCDCEATEADALALLHVYRARKRINAGMAAQRKAAKA